MVNNVVLGLMLVYGLIGLSMWVIGLVAADRRGNFRSASNVAIYFSLGFIVVGVYWPLGISALKEDLQDLREKA